MKISRRSCGLYLITLIYNTIFKARIVTSIWPIFNAYSNSHYQSLNGDDDDENIKLGDETE